MPSSTLSLPAEILLEIHKWAIGKDRYNIEKALGWKSPTKHPQRLNPHALDMLSMFFLQTRKVPKIKTSKHRHHFLEYKVNVELNLSSTKSYEIFCHYTPSLVWKKVGPMTWTVKRWPKFEWQEKVRYLDYAAYAYILKTSDIEGYESFWSGQLICDNECSVNWGGMTYDQVTHCTDIPREPMSFGDDYYREYRTIAKNGGRPWETKYRSRPREYLGYFPAPW